MTLRSALFLRTTAGQEHFDVPLAATILLVVTLSAVLGCRGSPSSGPTVTVGDTAFEVEIARTSAERVQGLSGRESLMPMKGMLFVFETGKASTFWMRGMQFALDFVWIGEDCTVVDTTLNVLSPAPGTPNSELTTYRSAVPAAYTLEINAGEVERQGIDMGDRVSFSGISAEGADC